MPKKQLNLKLVFWTLGPCLSFGFGVHVLHGFQAQDHAQTMQARAEEAEAAGDLKRAAGSWSRYLVFAPDDRDAGARYAMLLERLAATPRARLDVLALYRTILAREPARKDVRRRLAVLAMNLGYTIEARNQVEVLLEGGARDAELHDLLGQCREVQGEHPQAALAYEQAIAAAPGRIESYVRLSRILRHRLYDSKKADKVMDDMVKHNPASHAAYLERTLYRQANGALGDAAKDVKQAEKLAPANGSVLIVAARLAEQRGDRAEARRIWLRGVRVQPNDWQMHLGLADVEIKSDRPREALAALRRGLAACPKSGELQSALAEALIGVGEVKEAERLLGALEKEDGTQAAPQYLRARILMRKRQWTAAIGILEDAVKAWRRPSGAKGRAYFSLGECHEALGSDDRALAMYEQASALDPSPSVAVNLGAALLAQGKVEEAEKRLRDVTRLPQAPPESWTLLTRILIHKNDGLAPEQRDWREVDRLLDCLGGVPSHAAAAKVLRADVLMARNKTDEARRLLEDARTAAPHETQFVIASANLEARAGKPRQAAKIIREGRRLLGPRLDLCLAQIDHAAGLASTEMETTLNEVEGEANRLTRPEQTLVQRRLAQRQFESGNMQPAERSCRRLLKGDPADLPALVLLFEIERQTQRMGPAEKTLAEIRRVEGEAGTRWRYGEVMLLLAAKKDKQALARARRLVDEIAEQRPTWWRVPFLRAYIEQMDGKPERSVQHYLAAIQRGERNPRLLNAAARSLAESGRYDEADQVMTLREAQGTLARGEARLGADIALRAGKQARAVRLAGRAVWGASTDYREHVWHAKILAAAGRTTEAEDVFREAIRLGGATSDVWVAHVVFLSEIGRGEEVEAALREMGARLTPNQVPLALASCYEGLGRSARAEEQYRAALAKKPGDFLVLANFARFYVRMGEPDKAEPYLRNLLQSDSFVPAQTLAWARRELALVLATKDGTKKKSALELIERNFKEASEPLLDRRARAFVRASQPGKRPEALRELEETLPLGELTHEDRYRLAKLYETEGDWKKAEAQLLVLLEGTPRIPAYVSHYIEELLKRREVAAARVWLAKLQRIDPESVRTRDLQARVQRAKKQ